MSPLPSLIFEAGLATHAGFINRLAAIRHRPSSKSWSRKVTKSANHMGLAFAITPVLRDIRTNVIFGEPLESLHVFWTPKSMASLLLRGNLFSHLHFGIHPFVML